MQSTSHTPYPPFPFALLPWIRWNYFPFGFHIFQALVVPAAQRWLFTHVHMKDSGDFGHLCVFHVSLHDPHLVTTHTHAHTHQHWIGSNLTDRSFNVIINAIIFKRCYFLLVNPALRATQGRMNSERLKFCAVSTKTLLLTFLFLYLQNCSNFSLFFKTNQSPWCLFHRLSPAAAWILTRQGEADKDWFWHKSIHHTSPGSDKESQCRQILTTARGISVQVVPILGLGTPSRVSLINMRRNTRAESSFTSSGWIRW